MFVFVVVVVCLLGLVSNIVILSVTCYHWPTFVVFVVRLVVNVVFLVIIGELCVVSCMSSVTCNVMPGKQNLID